ncbi:carbon-nitrogen hydrolase family protein [methane-oxidizing endosymbiont of Gigantopelta aegis]|uniref:carbon-nitrogen hydrolase family protein n=1 Tax=methane-oxidizing endosymbiont of Gigantopelta aegis TaxID=2794938 RepID=UPI0018DE4678|nr:carbon-nitrogen hydrolase family protein [methane-oxidizing endosymbiont of Gigantopelta aegis]
MLKLAVAQYDVSFLDSWAAYEKKIQQWVSQAAQQQAQLLVFPEYHSMELASLFDESIYRSLTKQLDAMQGLLADFLALYRQLATQYGVYIQAGTFPVLNEIGEYRNRAYLFTPDGGYDFQEKLMMTRFENEQWHIKAGQIIKLFDTDFGKLGIAVCYDSEFPHYARHMAEQGAALILVPSCTDTKAGYYRVRIGCQARALENQCYVVQSPLVGEAPWSEAVDINCGAAAVYTPVDKGFPYDGILAIGEYNQTQWLYADLNLEKMIQVRENGQVFNYHDWPRQFNAELETL